jgi:predicted nucleic acid-binding protein
MVIAAHQELTRQWWKDRSGEFELFISELVQEEARRGDPDAAANRLEVLGKLPIISISDVAVTLAEHLVSEGHIPQESAADALHIAIAAVNGIDFLLTWNCKHLANASHRNRIETLVEGAGYACPVICTPEELMED